MGMPRPSFFLRQSCTITVATMTDDTYGAPTSTAGATYTCACTLQPASSSLGFDMHRSQSVTGLDLYLDLTAAATAGGAVTATLGLLAKTTRYTVDGFDYEADGEATNPCSCNGALVVNVQRVR